LRDFQGDRPTLDTDISPPILGGTFGNSRHAVGVDYFTVLNVSRVYSVGDH